MRRLATSLGVMLIAAACNTTASGEPPGHVRSQEPVVATLAPLGQAAPATSVVPASLTAAATVAPTTDATAAPTSAATAPSVLTGQLGLGNRVYDTVAGTGCTECHGPAGKGGVTELGDTAPDIRGATETKVRTALNGGAAAMSYLKLTDEEIEAVVAFLKYLNEQ